MNTNYYIFNIKKIKNIAKNNRIKHVDSTRVMQQDGVSKKNLREF